MIPRLISGLMAEERGRTRMMAMPEASDGLREAKCPGKLEADFSEVPLGDERKVVCISYERARDRKEIPSKKYCPNCPYNQDNLLKR